MLSVQSVAAARLPVVGEDANEWGTLLNDYLLTSHTPDGALKNFYLNGSNITFEGATDDDFNLILNIGDPTAERTITLPDASGEICLLGQTIESEEIADQTITGNDLAPDISITTTGDIILDSLDSVLKILGSNERDILLGANERRDGAYGIFDIAPLSGDRYYTFPDADGEVSLLGQKIDSNEFEDYQLRLTDDSDSYYGIIDVEELFEDTYYTFPDVGGYISILGQTIDSEEIEDGTVSTDDIADGTITDDDIEDGTLTIGNGGTPVTGHFSATADLVSENIPAASCGDYGTISVAGAGLGDTVVASPDAGFVGIETTDLMWNAYVSDIEIVTIRACNPTNADIDTDDGQVWRVDIWKH